MAINRDLLKSILDRTHFAPHCEVCLNLLLNSNMLSTPENEYLWVTHRFTVHGDLDFARLYLSGSWYHKPCCELAEKDEEREGLIGTAAQMVLNA